MSQYKYSQCRIVPCIGVLFVCSLSIASGDISKTVLSELFGSVNGLLDSSDGLAALLFKIFNISIMIFVSFFGALTITQSVIQTAAQGVFMGKKGSQSSYYTLFRTFGGMTLIFPQYNGYSLIQVIVMSIVLKGTALASALSQEILEGAIRTPPTFLFSETANASQNDASGQSLQLSRLSNSNVKSFYKGLMKGAICAVEENRKKEDRAFGSASSLYVIREGKIHFKGDCEPITLNFQGYNRQYSQVLVNSLQLLIQPVMFNVYHDLPRSTPRDASKKCIEIREGAENLPSFLQRIKRNIEQSHDSLASLFVFRLPQVDPPNIDMGSSSKSYLANWVNFPIMYQSVMELQADAQTEVSLEDLVSKALMVDRSLSTGSGEYTSLSKILSNINKVNETDYDAVINAMEFNAINPESFDGYVSQREKDQLTDRIKSYLSRLVYTPTYPLVAPRTLEDIWMNDSWETFDEGAATFAREQERLRTQSGSERALVDPVNAFVYYTANKWIDTYVTNMTGIILSPSIKLGEVAAYIGGQSTLFMFTTMRNVMAEQITRSYNLFWTFFGTEIALNATAAGTAQLQEMMGWDMMHCLAGFSPFAPNISLRAPCPPAMAGPLPVPPHYAMTAASGITSGVTTAANVAAHTARHVTAGLFSYLHMIASQYEYAFYGYLIAATTPVMIISNLLSVWIPMLPPLIYFISIIGWIFAVIEAMVAAPLVVMGITFPQGHDFLGSSQQVLILLLGVFIRAPLIVIGFFFGMLVLSTSMLALSYGIVPVALSIFQESVPTVGDGFLIYAFMIIILYITSSLLMHSMSIIYKLPNKILLWIGGQASEGIEEQAVQQIKSAVDQQQSSTLNSISQAGNSAQGSGGSIAASSTGGAKASGGYK